MQPFNRRQNNIAFKLHFAFGLEMLQCSSALGGRKVGVSMTLSLIDLKQICSEGYQG